MAASFDLTPYGIPYKLTPSFNFNTMKPENLRKGARILNAAGEVESFKLGPPPGVKYTVLETLGEGTHGIAYRVKGPDDVEYAIKFIKEPLTSKSEFLEFIKECIIQLLVVQATKSKPNGPYAPKIYEVCYNSIKGYGYIRSELMKNKLSNLIEAFSPDQNDVFVPDALSQIAHMVDDLQTTLQFNHRDLKGDNIMYVPGEGGKRAMRLIDFGLSCITWNGLKISGAEWFDAKHSCFKKDRDMSQLIFYILRYNAAKLSPELTTRLQLMIRANVGDHKCEMHKLCPLNGLTSWSSSYNFVDRVNVRLRGADPTFVEKNMGRFVEGKPFVSPKESAAAAGAGSAKPLPARDPKGICPLGKHKDSKSGRCVKDAPAAAALVGNAGEKSKPCPPGKVLNPKTRRCVKATGAVGRTLKARRGVASNY